MTGAQRPAKLAQARSSQFSAVPHGLVLDLRGAKGYNSTPGGWKFLTP
jgi:hypothetical protein